MVQQNTCFCGERAGQTQLLTQTVFRAARDTRFRVSNKALTGDHWVARPSHSKEANADLITVTRRAPLLLAFAAAFVTIVSTSDPAVLLSGVQRLSKILFAPLALKAVGCEHCMQVGYADYRVALQPPELSTSMSKVASMRSQISTPHDTSTGPAAFTCVCSLPDFTRQCKLGAAQQALYNQSCCKRLTPEYNSLSESVQKDPRCNKSVVTLKGKV